MTTEHDFQKALAMLPEEYKNSLMLDFLMQNKEAIRFALRLADKLLGQEPSIAAIDKAKAEYRALEKSCNEVGERVTWEGGALVVFESMLTTAVKEIDNGNS